jgi:hypothetical protein
MNARKNGNGAAPLDSRMLYRAQKQSERGSTLLPITLGLAHSNLRFVRRLIAAGNRPPKSGTADHE